MKFKLKPTKVASTTETIKKSYVFQSVYEAISYKEYYNLNVQQAISYYMSAAPLYTAVDLVAGEVSAIKPVLKDTKTGEFITDHPVLDLLANPNSEISGQEFMECLASFFLITGEAYPLITALESTPPKEIFCISPQAIAVRKNDKGNIGEISYSSVSGTHDFLSQDISVNKTNRTRFLTENRAQEIWQIKTFNPVSQAYNLRGLSPFTPLFYQIEQYLKADMHNLSLLKHGGRIGGVFTAKDQLDDEQYERLRQQIDTMYSGAENAGKSLLIDGEMDYDQMSMNLKDMDFAQLKSNVETAIYNALHIPLPIVKAENMTLANMATGKLNLYDNAVLPVVSRLLSELTLFLMPRYKNSENLIITYNDKDIPALEPRRMEQLEQINNLNVTTINETRSSIGRQDANGGDEIYRPATSIPIASTPDDDNGAT